MPILLWLFIFSLTGVSKVHADEDEYTIWGVDVNSGCQYSDHNIYIDIDARPGDITDLSLTIHAYDVDFKGSEWCTAGNEVDKVFINNNSLGVLTGADSSWSINIFPLERGMINGASATAATGTNHIFIDTDAINTGCWCVGIGRVEIKGKVGFQIDKITPKPDTRNIDWENPGITVTFNTPYNQTTLNNQTFKVFYWGKQGKVYVPGQIEYTSTTKATFKPQSGKLKDGLYHVAEILGKTDAQAAGLSQWVKGPSGKDLKHGRKWAFWTMPDLTGKITLSPIQVSRGSMLVPGKPAVIRVYAPWDKRDDIDPKWQVDHMEANVTLEDESGKTMLSPLRWTYKRSDLYNTQEKKRGVRSALFFNWTPPANWSGSHFIKAIVEPLHQPTTPPRTFDGREDFVVGSKSPTISYEYRAVEVGAWASGAPAPASFTQLIARSDEFMRSIYPVVRVTNRSAAAVKPDLDSIWCPTVPDKHETAQFLFYIWQMTTPKVDRMVGVVPNGWLGAGTLGGADFTRACGYGSDWGRGVVVLVDESAHGTILSHETGHTYGFVDETNELQDIDGFQLAAGGARGYNKSIPEGSFLTSLMYWQPDEPGATWIRNEHYNTLVGAFKVSKSIVQSNSDPVIPASGEQQFLLVSGAIDENDNLYLRPGRTQAFANMNPPAGTYSVAVENATGTLLNTISFEPAPPITGTDGLEYRYFTFPVSLPQGTSKLSFKHGTVKMAEIIRSANAPSLKILTPASGATWSGTKNVTWTGSDMDGDTVYYDILYSQHNGSTWTVLAIGLTGTSFSFDTTNVLPGTSALLKVRASDGFNTTESTVSLVITNGVVINAVSPSPGETDAASVDSIQIFFNNEMDAGTLFQNAFTLSNTSGDKVAGTLTYDAESRKATFVPDNELAYNAQYTASLAAGVADIYGNTLAAAYTWTFNTEADDFPPLIVNSSPLYGAINAPVNALMAVTFNENMNAGSINATTFKLSGGISGQVSYNANSRTAIFKPTTNLAPDTAYTATVTKGVQDAVGNAMENPYEWHFTTGSNTSAGIRFTGNYADRAVDDDGDGLFDRLIIEVGVEVLSSGTCNLNGRLTDSNGESIEWATAGNTYLTAGIHTLQLIFPGDAICSHGVDGPYTLTALHFYNAYNTSVYVSLTEAYNTYAYDPGTFFALLTLTGLPDTTLGPGESRNNAFNLNDYAEHKTLPDSDLIYTIDINTDSRCGVSIDSDDNVDISPEAGWVGSSEVTIKVSGGGKVARDTFRISIGSQECILSVATCGNGNVTSSPAGIDCGENCTATFYQGTLVRLTAEPDPGWSFTGWGGACSGEDDCLLIMNGDKTASADFTIGRLWDFNDNDIQGWEDDGSGLWSASDGAYVMTGNGGDEIRTSYHDQELCDFEYQADIMKTRGDSDYYAYSYGLRIRGDGTEDNYYEIVIVVDGWYLIGKSVDGDFTSLTDWIQSDSLNTGYNQWNTLSIAAKDNQLRFYANGTLLKTINDTALSCGKVGIVTFDSSESFDPDTVAFDNIYLKAVNETSITLPAIMLLLGDGR